MRPLITLLFIVVLLSCNDEDPAPTLHSFINGSGLVVQDSSIIACAAGSADSVNVFYYPEKGYRDFRLWRLQTPTADPAVFGNYVEVSYPEVDIFNGYLRYFALEELNEETWVTVSGRSEEELVVAQPIRLKQGVAPTEVGPQLLRIDQTDQLSPAFTWQDGSYDGTAIYFQVVSDENNNLISGTYTFDQRWQFYDLSNVVLNIRDVMPAPALEAGKNYTFTLMGVTLDNWVNLFIEVPFRTN